jgi:hypothetical protein
LRFAAKSDRWGLEKGTEQGVHDTVCPKLQDKVFMRRADKNFVLRAKGQPALHCHLSMGFVTQSSWKVRELEVIIPTAQYSQMVKGVEYTLHPLNSNKRYEWKVRDGVTLTRQ